MSWRTSSRTTKAFVRTVAIAGYLVTGLAGIAFTVWLGLMVLRLIGCER